MNPEDIFNFVFTSGWKGGSAQRLQEMLDELKRSAPHGEPYPGSAFSQERPKPKSTGTIDVDGKRWPYPVKQLNERRPPENKDAPKLLPTMMMETTIRLFRNHPLPEGIKCLGYLSPRFPGKAILRTYYGSGKKK